MSSCKYHVCFAAQSSIVLILFDLVLFAKRSIRIVVAAKYGGSSSIPVQRWSAGCSQSLFSEYYSGAIRILRVRGHLLSGVLPQPQAALFSSGPLRRKLGAHASMFVLGVPSSRFALRSEVDYRPSSLSPPSTARTTRSTMAARTTCCSPLAVAAVASALSHRSRRRKIFRRTSAVVAAAVRVECEVACTGRVDLISLALVKITPCYAQALIELAWSRCASESHRHTFVDRTSFAPS
jgi:hypothetical protein